MFNKDQIAITNEDFSVRFNNTNVIGAFSLSEMYDDMLVLVQSGPDLYWYT
jgi:hypothetical protein